MSNQVLESTKTRIHDIVGLAVMRLDVNSHKKIYSEEHKENKEFEDNLKILNDIRGISPDIKYVYTLRENEFKDIVFVIDSDPDLTSRASVNTKVESITDGMREAFKNKKGIFVNADYYTDKWGTWMTGFATFSDSEGNFEGVLAVDISVNTIKAKQYKNIITISFAGLIVASLSIFLSIFISNKISKPILLVTKEMEEIQKFNIDNFIQTNTRIVEIREMIFALENMKKSLRSFKKYVPSEIVSSLIKSNKEAILEVEKKDVCIFFSDIASFTSLSEKVPPETLSKMLGIYLGLVTKTILNEHGTVDKYIGDAVMAIWNAPNNVEEFNLKAATAAIQCILRLKKLNQRFEKIGLPKMETRIGLNTGESIVGNMGYRERLSYTAIGDSVNLAARLEGANKMYATSILISEVTYHAIKEKFLTRFIDIVAVKGKEKGVKIFELINSKDKATPEEVYFAEKFSDAMNLYLARKFTLSLNIFLEFRKNGKVDQALNLMIDRCLVYERNPPKQDWDGVVHLKEK